MKYPISKEFFPLQYFKAPVNPRMIRLAQRFMNPPGFLHKDPALHVETVRIPVVEGEEIELYLLTPRDLKTPSPCLIHIHGGGFVFEGYNGHYRLAMTYAKEAHCKVVYVRYRLAPDHPFPVPQEDCFAALCWVYDHAQELGIDRRRIGMTGDSAGGTLVVTSCLLARERRCEIRPLFEALIYPWLDDRRKSDSYLRYTDTPMWNSTLSQKVGRLTNPHPEQIPHMLYSPVEVASLEGMPPAYVEVAEFDCLHDDGVFYAKRLQEAGIEAVLHETKGTLHGFDTKLSAPTTQKMVRQRIAYMKERFYPVTKDEEAEEKKHEHL